MLSCFVVYFVHIFYHEVSPNLSHTVNQPREGDDDGHGSEAGLESPGRSSDGVGEKNAIAQSQEPGESKEP